MGFDRVGCGCGVCLGDAADRRRRGGAGGVADDRGDGSGRVWRRRRPAAWAGQHYRGHLSIDHGADRPRIAADHRRIPGGSVVHPTRVGSLDLRAGRQPAQHSRPRRLPREGAGKRHRIAGRLGFQPGPSGAYRPAGGRQDRGDPGTGDIALRQSGDRRRGQRHQQPHSGNPGPRRLQRPLQGRAVDAEIA